LRCCWRSEPERSPGTAQGSKRPPKKATPSCQKPVLVPPTRADQPQKRPLVIPKQPKTPKKSQALCAIRFLAMQAVNRRYDRYSIRPQKYPPARREPTRLSIPGIFPREGRDPDEFLTFLLQMKPEMEGLLQVFVHQQEIRVALG